MRQFDYSHLPQALLTQETVELLAAVHEHKGREQLHLSIKPDILDAMAEVAVIQSTGASNSLEGIRTTDRRLKDIMTQKTDLKSRDEEEIAGYRDVLATVHESYAFIDVTPNIILQLHRNLYRYTASTMGGHFKIGDNEIRGIRPDGSEYVRFKPVPAVATPDAMKQLCDAFNSAVVSESIDPLIASLLFVFDFTCVHPFNDGNGRMSRLLILLLLYKAGYMVGKYVSIEKEIERTKGDYYEALAASSDGWDTGENDPGPFIRYMLGTLLACYRDFEERVSAVSQAKLSKTERVETYLSKSIGPVKKAEIAAALPDVSTTTIERTLAALLEGGKIEKIGAGRGTAYVWKTGQPVSDAAGALDVAVDFMDEHADVFEELARVASRRGAPHPRTVE